MNNKQLNELRNYFDVNNLTQKDIANKMGVSVVYVNAVLNGRKDIGKKQAENLENLFGLSKSWLLTGEGQMIKNESAKPTLQNVMELPLLPVDALAGKLTGTDISVMEYDCEKYIIPAFKGAEYLVRVSGVSMMPQYMPGDIVACKPVVMDNLWFQWGKTYVLATNQGVLIKRIEQSQTTGCVTLRSYNPDYAPFDLPAEEIHGVSLVVGLVRVE